MKKNFFSETRKRSERVIEKEKLLNVTPLEDVEIPHDWACIFYFTFDSSFVKLKANSPRWPPGMKNSAKISLDEGNMVWIECTRGNDTKFHLEGEFKVQGKEPLMNKTIRELCRLRDDGIDPKLIDTQKVIDDLVGDRPRVDEDENEEPKKGKYPKLRKDIELFGDEVADEPDFSLDMIDELVRKEQLKDQANGASNKECNGHCSGSVSNSDEVRLDLRR